MYLFSDKIGAFLPCFRPIPGSAKCSSGAGVTRVLCLLFQLAVGQVKPLWVGIECLQAKFCAKVNCASHILGARIPVHIRRHHAMADGGVRFATGADGFRGGLCRLIVHKRFFLPSLGSLMIGLETSSAMRAALF